MKKNVALIYAFLLLTLPAFAQGPAKPKFKIVGYYQLKAIPTTDLSTIPFDKLTHINLSFMNPDTLGNFKEDYSYVMPFIQAAHAKGVKVLPSICGGGSHPYYHFLLKDENRSQFIKNLVDVAVKYGFDGVDVDIERRDIDENYEKFATELSAALHAKKLLSTTAIAILFKESLTAKALAQYDFVNIMSYDRTSPNQPDNPGPHSLYAHAAYDLEYFHEVMKLPKEKMILGVGFYGYGFGPDLKTPGITMNYNQLITNFPGAEFANQWYLPGGKIIYYDGIPGVKQKTQLAKQEAGGMMFWQLTGDAKGKKSLLNAIYEEAYDKEATYKKETLRKERANKK